MDDRLQKIAIHLTDIIAHADNESNVTYIVATHKTETITIVFHAFLWDLQEEDIIKSFQLDLTRFDTDISIAKKVVKITNIINGVVNPFEEVKNDHNE